MLLAMEIDPTISIQSIYTSLGYILIYADVHSLLCWLHWHPRLVQPSISPLVYVHEMMHSTTEFLFPIQSVDASEYNINRIICEKIGFVSFYVDLLMRLFLLASYIVNWMNIDTSFNQEFHHFDMTIQWSIM